MAEVVSENVTRGGSNGWLAHYEIRRDDGETVTVEASCTRTGEAMAGAGADEQSRQYVADYGKAAALQYAESAQSPKLRGTTLVRLSIDTLSGGVRHDYTYERMLGDTT